MVRHINVTALAVCIGLIGSTAHSADLVDIYEQAINSDPELLAAKYDYNSTREVKNQAYANFLPQISGSYSKNETTNTRITPNAAAFADPSLPATVTTESDSESDTLSLNLRQTIYDQNNYETLKSARRQVSRAEADYDNAYQAFLLRVAERYFAVLTSTDALAFAQAEEKAVGRQLEQAEQRYEVGLTAITDVHEARAQHDSARAAVITAQNSLDDAKESLTEITGGEVLGIDPLREKLVLSQPEPADINAWVDIGLQSNPALISSKKAAEVAEATVRQNRTGHLPTLDLSVSYSDSDSLFPTTDPASGAVLGVFPVDSENTSYNLTLNVPIFSGGRTASQVRQARHSYEAALQRYEQQRRSVVRQSRNAYRGTQASILAVQARQQALVSAQSALEATEAGFEVGTRTIVDVLLSQRQLFQAQRDYSQARHDYILNRLRLEQAAGVLELNDLQGVNALLQ